jgi:predicted phosphodiesterase
MLRHFNRADLDVLVYGDSHVERIDTFGKTLCVNPGSPTYPRNLNTCLGTIGFLEISGGLAEATIWQLTEDGIAPFDWSTWRRPR